MTDKTREEFEAYQSDNGLYPKAVEQNSSDIYILMQTAAAWDVWQAATERRQARIAELDGMVELALVSAANTEAKAVEKVTELEAALVKEREDAERFRYIVDGRLLCWANAGQDGIRWTMHLKMPEPDFSAENLTDTSVTDELRAAIDAARKATK